MFRDGASLVMRGSEIESMSDGSRCLVEVRRGVDWTVVGGEDVIDAEPKTVDGGCEDT